MHEEIFGKIQESYSVASDLIENGQYTPAERHAIASELVLDFTHFVDAHSLYLSENVCVHCGAMWMDIDNYHYIDNPKEREEALKRFWRLVGEAKDMIRAKSGLQQFDKLFGIVTRPKYQSAIADYAQKLKMELKREGRI